MTTSNDVILDPEMEWLRPGITINNRGRARFLQSEVSHIVFIKANGYKPDGTKYNIDHINDNPLDNRSDNLEAILKEDNSFKGIMKALRLIKSKFGYVGVNKSSSGYRAIFINKGKRTSSPQVESREKAAQIWDFYARQAGYSTDVLNFPDVFLTQEDINSAALPRKRGIRRQWNAEEREKISLNAIERAKTNHKLPSNKTGYTGVKHQHGSSKFEAKIRSAGITYYLGTYDTPEEAAIVRDIKAVELGYKRDMLNFPELF